jgi:hypothetical protein
MDPDGEMIESDPSYAVHPRWLHRLMSEHRRNAQYTRPFARWEDIRVSHPEHLEVRRFNALPAQQQSTMWHRRRAHSPCNLVMPEDWKLDALYFRAPEEEAYARRLRDLRVTPEGVRRLCVELLCLDFPVVPYQWPLPQTPCPVTFSNFSPRGDLMDPKGGRWR